MWIALAVIAGIVIGVVGTFAAIELYVASHWS